MFQGERRFIVAGTFIDGSGAAGRRNVVLTVTDGIITAIGPTAELPRPAEAALADFSHCTILPALVDCSVALARSPSVDCQVRSAADQADFTAKAALVEKHLAYCHAHGVLGVADSDDLSGLVTRYRPGSAVTVRTSGPLWRSSQDGAADSAAGRDFLKIAYSADIGAEGIPTPQLTPAELALLLRQRGGKKAVVVANGRQQVAEALAAGCDAIEQGYDMGEENLRALAARKVLWIPSVLRAKNALDGAGSGGSICCRFSHRYVAPGQPLPGAEAFWKKVLAAQLAQLRLAREVGVTTAVGSGAGSVGILHGESLAEEMKLFLKAGYSLEETIRCASANGAEFFGMAKLGALLVGRPATFLLARGSLPQLPRKLSYLEGIYVDGAPSRHYRKNPVKPG